MPAIYKNFGVLDEGDIAEKLFNVGFMKAATLIKEMNIHEKADVAAAIEKKIHYMYDLIHTKYNDNLNVNVKMTSAEYMHIMSKVKRYEILLEVVYDINGMLSIDDINTKLELIRSELLAMDLDPEESKEVQKLERQLEEITYDPDLITLANSLTAALKGVK